MMLMDLVRDEIKKNKLGSEEKYTPIYSTGFDILDYRLGRDSLEGFKTGVDGGKIISIIGKSGTGRQVA